MGKCRKWLKIIIKKVYCCYIYFPPSLETGSNGKIPKNIKRVLHFNFLIRYFIWNSIRFFKGSVKSQNFSCFLCDVSSDHLFWRATTAFSTCDVFIRTISSLFPFYCCKKIFFFKEEGIFSGKFKLLYLDCLKEWLLINTE